jgi:hypothetical protein
MSRATQRWEDRTELRRGGVALSPIIEDPRILLYSRIRKSPFFSASRRHGVAMYSVYNHTYHPRHYGDPWGSTGSSSTA